MCPPSFDMFETQEAHHKQMSFDSEFLALLKKHGVEFDPKFAVTGRCRTYGACDFVLHVSQPFGLG